MVLNQVSILLQNTTTFKGLTSVGIVPPSIDISLQVLSVRQLRFEFFLLLFVPLLTGLVEIGEVSLPVVESLRVLVHNISSDGIQECSIVRSESSQPVSLPTRCMK